MEVDANLNMVENSLQHRYFIIDVIVSDNYSTTESAIKNPSRSAWVKVLKSSKGNLDGENPVTYFFAYSTHQLKVHAKHVFFIINDRRAHQCGCNK